MDKRAVLYARCSGDDRGKDGRNLEGQLDLARQYAISKGYEIVEEIAEDDRGASGAAFELEGLNRVREMAAAGDFDVLVPREIDRLSRNLAKQLIVEEELRRAGVGIEYALAEYPDTPEGRLSKHIRATIAEYEREKIMERMNRGRYLTVKAGNVITHGLGPYGYRVEEKDGKRTLVIDEAEAQIVRAIFIWYVWGDGNGDGPLGAYAIAQRLEGVPTRADMVTTNHYNKKRGVGQWAKTTLCKMIGNETYAGTWYYRKRGNNGKPNPANEWIAVSVPAIVSRELWEAAQLRVLANRHKAHNGGERHEYLMSGHLACGDCGSAMCRRTGHDPRTGKAYRYYSCRSRIRDNAHWNLDCELPIVPADPVDEAVWDWVKSFLSDPAELAAALDSHRAKQERRIRPLADRVLVIDDLLADNRRQLGRLLDLYIAGDFSKEMLSDRKARLETTIAGLDRERAALAAQLEEKSLAPEQILDIQTFAEKVRQGMEGADADFALRRRIIERLQVEGTLTVEDGEFLLYVRCLLGAVEVPRLPIAYTKSRRGAA